MAVAALAISAAFASVTAAVATFATALTFGAGLMAGISAWTTVASVAALGAALVMKPPGLGSQGQQVNIQMAGPNAAIPLIFGRTGTQGVITYRGTYGSNNDTLIAEHVLSVGPIQAVESFSVTGRALTFSGNPSTSLATVTQVQGVDMRTSKLYRYGGLKVAHKLGAHNDTSTLSSITGESVPGITSAHTMPGLARTILRCQLDEKRLNFPEGYPDDPISVVKGVKCYDPRLDSTYPGGSGSHRWADQSTHQWSENPFIVGLNFIRGWFSPTGTKLFGLGADQSMIDVASFVAAANVADANDWTTGGQVLSTDGDWTILTNILASGGGIPTDRGGKISCFVRSPKVSTFTLKAADVLYSRKVSTTTPMSQRANRIVPHCRQEYQKWELIAGEAVTDAGWLEDDGGNERTEEISFPLVNSYTQAHQLAAYYACDAREFLEFEVMAKPRALAVDVGDCIEVELEEFADGQTWIVMGRKWDAASKVVSLVLKSETFAKHAFALGQSQVAPEPPELEDFDPTNPAGPGSSDWEITANSISANGAIIPALVVAGEVKDPNVQKVVIEVREPITEADVWPEGTPGDLDEEDIAIAMAEFGWSFAIDGGRTTTQLTVSPIAPATAFEVSVRYERLSGALSERLILDAVTTAQDQAGGVGPGTVDWSKDDYTGPLINRPISLTNLDSEGRIYSNGVSHLGSAISDVITSINTEVAQTQDDLANAILESNSVLIGALDGANALIAQATTYRDEAQANATAAFTQAGYAQTNATASATRSGWALANATAAAAMAALAISNAVIADTARANTIAQRDNAIIALANTAASRDAALTSALNALSNAAASATSASYAATNATSAQTSAGYAGANATISQTQAGYAGSNTVLALSNATLSATYSGYAAANAAASNASRGFAAANATIAQTQAGYATSNAATASTQSGLATTFAGQAQSNATLSATQLGYATANAAAANAQSILAANYAGTALSNATSAATQAGYATANAALATAQATLSASFAGYAATNATAAQTQAGYSASNATLSTTQAGYSTANAAMAATNATLSATRAGYAQTNATVAQTQAGYATANAATATTQAALSAGYASNANASAASLFPDRYSGSGQFFAGFPVGAPTSITDNPSNATASGYGPVREDAIVAGFYIDWSSRGVFAATPGRIYKIEVEYQVTSLTGTDTTQAALQIRGLDASFASTGATGLTSNFSHATTAIRTISGMIAATASSGVVAWGASDVWLRPYIRFLAGASSNGTIQFRRMTVTDVTQSVLAAANATIATTQAGYATSNAALASTSATLSATYSGYAAANASAAQTQAGYSAANATIASTQSGYATSNAATATTQAGLSTTFAGYAATNATAAQTQAGYSAANATISTAQAGYSTANAAIATTQAGLSTTFAGYSAANATAASTSAGYSLSNATIATTQAGYSTANAATATTQATLSTTFAGYAATNAATATTQAGYSTSNATISTTQAGYSTSNAAMAATNATLSATRAGYAQTNATVATTQAGYATTNAALASTSATLSASHATNAASAFANTVLVGGNQGFDDGLSGWGHGTAATAWSPSITPTYSASYQGRSNVLVSKI